jgi:hypothetical protein
LKNLFFRLKAEAARFRWELGLDSPVARRLIPDP